MRSFTHIDYLNLEISQINIMKLMVADKSTQSEDCKHNHIVSECNSAPSNYPTTLRAPPTRPPPPKISKSLDESTMQKTQKKKYGTENFSKLNENLKMKKRFQNFKTSTIKFTKNVHRRISNRPKKSESVNEVCSIRTSTTDLERRALMENLDFKKSENRVTPSSEVHHRSKPLEQMERCKSLNYKSTPPRISRSVIQMNELINKDESLFSKFAIMPLITEFLALDSNENEITGFDHCVDRCLNSFVTTCNRQVTDTIKEINDRFSHSVDLDAIVIISSQPDITTVYCIPGWKHMRIIEDNKTKERFICLKNTSYQSWVLLNQNVATIDKRWTCFPIQSIYSLKSQIALLEKDDFQKILLKLIMTMFISNMYKEKKCPTNIELNTAMIVTSKCGIIIMFKECLNEAELFTMELVECDSVESIPDVVKNCKMDTQQLIEEFFHRPDVISVLISSTWPLDYLALLLAELVIDNNE